MDGSVAGFLNEYVFPLAGLSLLLSGAWFSWEVWKPGTGRRFVVMPSGSRLAAGIIGLVAGWFLTNLEYSRDPQHVTVGFPMPVMTLAKVSGHWLELGSMASIPCLLLNLAIGLGLANTLLYFLWKRRSRLRSRRRLAAPRTATARRELPFSLPNRPREADFDDPVPAKRER